MTHFRRVRHCERHRLRARRASGKDLMVGIDQVDQNLVLAGWHSGDVDCIGVARVRKLPEGLRDLRHWLNDGA